MSKINSFIRSVLYIFIYITLSIAPLYVIRWSYFGYLPTTLLELFVVTTIVIWLLYKFLTRSFSFTLPVYFYLVLLFIAAGTISIFTSNDLFYGLGRFRAFILEPILFMFIAFDLYQGENESNRLRMFGKSLDIVKIIYLGLYSAGLWLSILGILQKVFGIAIVTFDQAYRAHGVYNNGNQLAHVLGPLILVLVYKIVYGVRKPYLYGLLYLLLIAFLFADSLGGYIALTFGVCLILSYRMLHIKQRASRLLITILVFGSIGFFVFWSQISAFTPKDVNPWARTSSTMRVRLCLWEGTKNVLEKNPIFGTGLVGFSEAYKGNYTCDAEALEEPDNILLIFWTKMGVFGLVVILLLLYKIYSTKIALLYKLPFIYMFIHGLVDPPYFKNDLSLYWWIFFALLAMAFQNKGISQEYKDRALKPKENTKS